MSSDNGVKVNFTTGPAGCGKSYMYKQRVEEDPGSCVLTATTGVSAVNMDTTTIHSTLGFFDTDGLIDSYVRGRVHRRLRALAQPDRAREIVIDEVSMLHAEQLDIIYKAIHEVNVGDDQHDPLKYPLGLTVTGDFCQLPPVKGRWAFQADCWPEFASNTTRLTKIWRQSDPAFLAAINAARRGDGPEAATGLRSLGVDYSMATDMNYDGTTIVAKNLEADRYNSQRLLKLTTPSFAVTATRWGQQSQDWRNIPDRLILKPTCLVMLLANKRYPDSAFEQGLQYVNGDLAHVIQYDAVCGVQVTSVRTGETFWVDRLVRENTVKDVPDAGVQFIYDEENNRNIIGTISFFPMRLGYCSTVHKSQGLSLDRVQIDARDGFFGSPSMAYVALSRARTVAGMRIVGGAEMLARRIKLNPEVRSWL